MRRTVRPAVRESDIQRWARQALKTAGIYFVEINHTAQARGAQRGTTPGCSDFVALQPGTGRFVALEFKVPGGKLSDNQIAFRDSVVAAGGIYAVIESAEQAIAAVRGTK